MGRFRGEFLRELEIATRQSIAVAEAFPLDKYGWRPDPQTRVVSEVFLRVAVGCFMLLGRGRDRGSRRSLRRSPGRRSGTVPGPGRAK